MKVDDTGDADFLVCAQAADPSPFTDNVHGVCSQCGVAIMWRPHVPPKPKKICVGCAVAQMSEADWQRAVMSPQTRDELAKIVMKRKH